MAASREDISRWFDEGVAKNATHMIVVCDTYDWEDYPVYVSSNPEAAWHQNNGPNMTRAMECYALWKSKDEQMRQHRVRDFEEAMNLPPQAKETGG